jgi:hypothetical protein
MLMFMLSRSRLRYHYYSHLFVHLFGIRYSVRLVICYLSLLCCVVVYQWISGMEWIVMEWSWIGTD